MKTDFNQEQHLNDLKNDPRYKRHMSKADARRAGVKRNNTPHREMAKHAAMMHPAQPSPSYRYASHTNPVVTSKRGKPSRPGFKYLLKPNAKVELKNLINEEAGGINKDKLLQRITKMQPGEVIRLHDKEYTLPGVNGKVNRFRGKVTYLPMGMFRKVVAGVI